jgi:hypothetical protein
MFSVISGKDPRLLRIQLGMKVRRDEFMIDHPMDD